MAVWRLSKRAIHAALHALSHSAAGRAPTASACARAWPGALRSRVRARRPLVLAMGPAEWPARARASPELRDARPSIRLHAEGMRDGSADYRGCEGCPGRSIGRIGLCIASGGFSAKAPCDGRRLQGSGQIASLASAPSREPGVGGACRPRASTGERFGGAKVSRQTAASRRSSPPAAPRRSGPTKPICKGRDVSAPGALPQSRPQSRPQSASKAPAKLFFFLKYCFTVF